MNSNNDREAQFRAGIPYDDITWYDIVGQPFGTASYFNAIIFGDMNNIVDTKGAMAVGGYLIDHMGSIPQENDDRTIEMENLVFKLESVKNKRIDKVKLYIGKKEEEQPED